jgi:hypothetical protein
LILFQPQVLPCLKAGILLNSGQPSKTMNRSIALDAKMRDLDLRNSRRAADYLEHLANRPKDLEHGISTILV